MLGPRPLPPVRDVKAKTRLALHTLYAVSPRAHGTWDGDPRGGSTPSRHTGCWQGRARQPLAGQYSQAQTCHKGSRAACCHERWTLPEALLQQVAAAVHALALCTCLLMRCWGCPGWAAARAAARPGPWLARHSVSTGWEPLKLPPGTGASLGRWRLPAEQAEQGVRCTQSHITDQVHEVRACAWSVAAGRQAASGKPSQAHNPQVCQWTVLPACHPLNAAQKLPALRQAGKCTLGQARSCHCLSPVQLARSAQRLCCTGSSTPCTQHQLERPAHAAPGETHERAARAAHTHLLELELGLYQRPHVVRHRAAL